MRLTLAPALAALAITVAVKYVGGYAPLQAAVSAGLFLASIRYVSKEEVRYVIASIGGRVA